MASAPGSSGGSPRDAREPAGGGVVWHSTCGYADCVEPSRYAADMTCKGCRRIKYCAFACQKADWKRHRLACKADAAADEAAAALVARPLARAPPPEPELLLEAAEYGHVKRAEELLWLGADVNAANARGLTPLHMAAVFGHAAVASVLLAARGVAVNAREKGAGFTPLIAASQNGHVAVVAAILAAPGVDINAVTRDGATALKMASQKGHVATVTALLAAPGVEINARSKSGSTPLQIASFCGHTAVVAALLAAPGVSINTTMPDGATPLFAASQNGHAAVVAALVASPGIDVNAPLATPAGVNMLALMPGVTAG